jgi:S1-C subfamily serine protease
MLNGHENSETSMSVPDAWEGNAWNNEKSPLSARSLMDDRTSSAESGTRGGGNREESAVRGRGASDSGDRGRGDFSEQNDDRVDNHGNRRELQTDWSSTGGGATDTTTSSTTGTGSPTFTDPNIESLQVSDPNIAQTLTDSQNTMTAAGYNQYEGIVMQNINSGEFPDDLSLMQASSYELGMQGGSQADVQAAQAVINNDLGQNGTLEDAAVSTYESSTGTSTGSSSSSGSWGGDSGAAAGTSSGSGSWGGDSGAAAAATGGGGDATGGGTAANNSIISQAEAATVQITAQDGGGEESLGSGYFTTAANGSQFIVTDYHVVQGAQGPIQITTADGQTLEAEPVYTDQGNDIAVLQLVGQGSNQTFPSLTIGNEDQVTGTDYAIGHPEGDPNIVVNSGQYEGEAPFGSFDVTDNTVADNPNRELLEFGNMDTEPGSSGSPIINSDGVVIGMDDIGDGEGDAEATVGSAILADVNAASTVVG